MSIRSPVGRRFPRESFPALEAQRAMVEYHLVPLTSEGGALPAEDIVERTFWKRVLESHVFMYVMSGIILANGAVIGLETDIRSFAYWDHIERVFLLIFIAEICLKMSVDGPRTFFNPNEQDFMWNIFDLFIVGLGMVDCIASLLGSSSGGFATIFRMVRLMRVLRFFRLIRVLKPLFMLAYGLIEACKAIIWVTILMSLVLYVLSIVLVRTVGEPPATDPHHDFLIQHFRTIPDSIITLFVLMSSPNLPIYQEEEGLLNSRPFFCLFLMLFICFGSFGMIAMLTGVINESMFENNELKKQERKEAHESMRLNLAKRSADLYETLPLDERGNAKVEELRDVVDDAADLLYDAGVQISRVDILKFLELMDDDEEGSINMSQFVHAIQKISEGVGPFAILEVQHYAGLCNKKMTKQLEQMLSVERKAQAQITHTSEEVDRILQEVTSDQTQHRSHLVEKIESQMLRTSEEVDRILEVVSSDQSEHRSHLVEKIESQMSRTSEEVDRILEVVTARQDEHKNHLVEKIEHHMLHMAEGVDRILEYISSGESSVSRSSPALGVVGGLVSNVQILSEFRRCESTLLAAVSKQTENVATTMQSAIERRFSDLERQFAMRENSNRSVQLRSSPQMQDVPSSLQKSLHEAGFEPKLDELLRFVQDRNKKEAAFDNFRSDLARLMQESKNSVARIARAQDAIHENLGVLTSKVSMLEKDADSLQTQLLGSVAELGGDVINGISDLLSTTMTTLKHELNLQRLHISTSLSRENTSSLFSRENTNTSILLSRENTARMQSSRYHGEHSGDVDGTAS